jgi:hypothetical protein
MTGAPCQNVSPARTASSRRWSSLIGLGYVIMLVGVFYSFEPGHLVYGLGFTVLNFFISFVYSRSVVTSANTPLVHLIYGVFLVAYVGKAIFEYIAGLDSFYLSITVRTVISLEDYFTALEKVTVCHLLVASILRFISVRIQSWPPPLAPFSFPKDAFIGGVGFLVLAWIVFSSVIMRHYGVALMGTEGVSLPFKLSAVLFYSRTVVIPLLLLHFLHKGLLERQLSLKFLSLFLFATLASAEVWVRATKAPFFSLSLYIGMMFWLTESVENPRYAKSRFLIVGVLGVVALVLWPVVEIYRELAVGGYGIDQFAQEFRYSLYSDGQFLPFAILNRLIQRLVGFTQFVGLVADGADVHALTAIFDYESLARYYTTEHLQLRAAGHLSSPSLLGALFIIGGQWGMFPLLVLYLLVVAFVWRVALAFVFFRVPVLCLISGEIFNSVIAGTIDQFLKTTLLILITASALEVGWRAIFARRAKMTVVSS